MTTQEKIELCRRLDDKTTYKVVICGNAETLADGYFDAEHSGLTQDEYACEVVSAAERVVSLTNGRVDTACDSNFQNWHGGKHVQGVGSTIMGTTYGYRRGWVCTHAENPPQWLCDLIDAMADAMTTRAKQLGDEADAEHAEWLAGQTEQEDDSCQ